MKLGEILNKAMGQKAMGKINPDRIQLIKEELRGRLAAIEARYAEELKAIASDLDELETLERAVESFAAKHSPELNPSGCFRAAPVVELATLPRISAA